MLSAKYTFEAIGTAWSIDTDRSLSNATRTTIEQTIGKFDQVYSRFRSDSLVMNMRDSSPGEFVFPPSLETLYLTYATLNQLSDGRINPLVGVSLEQLGYGAGYRLTPDVAQLAPVFTDVVTLHGDTTLETHEPVLLDIGAIGKGFLIDEIAKIVAADHDEMVVDGSGDIAVHTVQPEVIGLEHPLDTTRVIGTVQLTRGSLCASATHRRAWGDGLHHIIDATTGKPLETDIIATWAIADTTMIADALTTGLFFVAPEQLLALTDDFQYVIMRVDGTVTHNLQPETGELFV